MTHPAVAFVQSKRTRIDFVFLFQNRINSTGIVFLKTSSLKCVWEVDPHIAQGALTLMTAELHISYQDKTQSDTVLMETEMHHSTKTSEDRSDELSMCEK